MPPAHQARRRGRRRHTRRGRRWGHRKLRLNNMLHAVDGQMDFGIFAFVVWRELDGDVSCLPPFGRVVNAADETGGAAMTADDDHRAGRRRIVRNAFSEEEFCIRCCVHDETSGHAIAKRRWSAGVGNRQDFSATAWCGRLGEIRENAFQNRK